MQINRSKSHNRIAHVQRLFMAVLRGIFTNLRCFLEASGYLR